LIIAGQDEPPPNVSDLELSYPETPSRRSFNAYFPRGKGVLSRDISDELGSLEQEAFQEVWKLKNNYLYRDAAERWNNEAMSVALARIDPQFWTNLDQALQAPREFSLQPEGVLETINLARLIRYQAWNLVRNGNPEAGLRWATKNLELGNAFLENNPHVVSGFGGTAIYAIGYGIIWEIASAYPVSPECLRELRTIIRETRPSDDCLRNIFRGEFFYLQAHFSILTKELSQYRLYFAAGSQKWTLSRVLTGEFADLPNAEKLLSQNVLYKPNATERLHADLCRISLQRIGLDAQSLQKIAEAPQVINFEKSIRRAFPFDPRNTIGRRLLEPRLSDHVSFMKRWLSVKSMGSALEAALAVREYEMRHGRLPEALEELVPDYLPVVPVDYMDSQPVRYSKEERVVWSIGKNLDLAIPLPDPNAYDERHEFIFRIPPMKNE
jgi:hypothetical protein